MRGCRVVTFNPVDFCADRLGIAHTYVAEVCQYWAPDIFSLAALCYVMSECLDRRCEVGVLCNTIVKRFAQTKHSRGFVSFFTLFHSHKTFYATHQVQHTTECE